MAFSKVILVWRFKGLGRLKVRDSCTFFCLTPPLSQILEARWVPSWLRGKEQFRDQAGFETKTLGVTGGRLRLLDKRIFAEKGFAHFLKFGPFS